MPPRGPTWVFERYSFVRKWVLYAWRCKGRFDIESPEEIPLRKKTVLPTFVRQQPLLDTWKWKIPDSTGDKICTVRENDPLTVQTIRRREGYEERSTY